MWYTAFRVSFGAFSLVVFRTAFFTLVFPVIIEHDVNREQIARFIFIAIFTIFQWCRIWFHNLTLFWLIQFPRFRFDVHSRLMPGWCSKRKRFVSIRQRIDGKKTKYSRTTYGNATHIFSYDFRFVRVWSLIIETGEIVFREKPVEWMFVLPKPGEQFKEPFAAMNPPSNVFPGFVFLYVFLYWMRDVHLNNLLKMKNISLAI